MEGSRTKNSLRNIIWGLVSKFISILMPFAVRTVLINILSEAYVGVGSLFSSILQVLNLTELGFSTAVTFGLYKPIVDNDKSKIRAYLYYFRKIYRGLALIIFVAGLVVIPFLHVLIKKDCPSDINLYLLYPIYLINTCLGYALFGYKNTLLIAHQRADLTSKITTFSQVLKNVLEIIVLLLFKNYYIYALMMFAFTLSHNLLIHFITKRKYPDLYPNGKLDLGEKKVLKQNVKDMFGHRLGGVIINSFDSIIISAFLGSTILGAYTNYYYIMNAISGIVALLLSSLTASIGNKIVNDDPETNYKLFKKIDFVYKWIISVCTCCLISLYQPFMKVWSGMASNKITMFSIYFVILLSTHFYFLTIRNTLCVYKDASGTWHSDRYRPYIESILNLTLNLSLIYLLGLNSIVFSSIVAVLFGYPWLTDSVFKDYFKRSPKEYYLKLLYNIFITFVASCLALYLTTLIKDTIFTFILKCIIALIIPNLLLLIANCKSKDFKDILSQGFKVIKKLFSKQQTIATNNTPLNNPCSGDIQSSNMPQNNETQNSEVIVNTLNVDTTNVHPVKSETILNSNLNDIANTDTKTENK